MSWLMISVGVGNKSFNLAADRVVSQAVSMGTFDKCIALKDPDVLRLVPDLKSRLFDDNGDVTVGYGFYSWKSRISKLALDGEFGEYDNLLILDAGCEIFKSSASLLMLRKYMLASLSQGVLAFTISTPESLFTKKSLFSKFPNLDSGDITGQFQSGILFFSGAAGREAVKLWDEIVWQDVANVDETLGGERDDFCLHRHDQSVLSLVLKSLGIVPPLSKPMGLPRGFRSMFACYLQPVWWARNRTGDSQVPFLLKLAGSISTIFPSQCAYLLIWISERLTKR
jgi:hypothetical protein